MLRVHIVSFDRWRGFSAISNGLLKSHRLFLYVCQKYFEGLRFDSVIICHPFLSILVANCWIAGMENCQNNSYTSSKYECIARKHNNFRSQ